MARGAWPLSVFRFSLFVSVFICVHLWPIAAAAQEQELVANLAAGRVLLCVAKDGIFIAAVENKVEPDATPPIVIPLSGRRVAVVFGAAEWLDPASGEKAARLWARELGMKNESTCPTVFGNAFWFA